MRLFSLTKYKSGHVHIECLNWFVQYNPNSMAWRGFKRPWPWSARGLSASDMRSFNRASRKQLEAHL